MLWVLFNDLFSVVSYTFSCLSSCFIMSKIIFKEQSKLLNEKVLINCFYKEILRAKMLDTGINWIKIFKILFYVCWYHVYLYVCVPCACSTHGDQKRVVKLKMWAVLWVLGIKSRSSIVELSLQSHEFHFLFRVLCQQYQPC